VGLGPAATFVAIRLAFWLGAAATVIWAPAPDRRLIGSAYGPASDFLFRTFAQWDARWFLQIAEHGYEEVPQAAAFFPVYPAAAHALAWLTGSTLVAGVLISLAAGAAAAPVLAEAQEHQAIPSDLTLRVKSLESLLVDKGLVDRVALDRIVDAFETQIGPRNGARVVARAWVDPAYKKRLLTDASTAMEELGFHRYQGEDIVALENTARIHNLVVCTMCSCYPWPLLGLPPVWYKSAAYRSRAVIDPRGVLKEFGVDIDADVEVRVWDSTAEIRYLVLPERPAGGERLTEAALAALVTRDSMIGTARITLDVTKAPA
jgi:nitrile hydratase